jgi:hypothetical protein
MIVFGGSTGKGCGEKYSLAVADFTEVIRLAPKSAAAYAARGEANISLGLCQTDIIAGYRNGLSSFNAAIADLQEARRLDSKSAEATIVDLGVHGDYPDGATISRALERAKLFQSRAYRGMARGE